MLGDETMTFLVTGVALAAVCVPFFQGIRISLAGWAATRRVPSDELRSNRPEMAGLLDRMAPYVKAEGDSRR